MTWNRKVALRRSRYARIGSRHTFFENFREWEARNARKRSEQNASAKREATKNASARPRRASLKRHEVTRKASKNKMLRCNFAAVTKKKRNTIA